MNIGPRRTCPSCGNEFSGPMQFCLVVEGPFIAVNLAVVYAWTDEPDLAFKAGSALGFGEAGLAIRSGRACEVAKYG